MMHTSSNSKTQNAFLGVSASSFAALFATGCSKKDPTSTTPTQGCLNKDVLHPASDDPAKNIPAEDKHYTLYYHEDFAARVRPLEAMLKEAKAEYTREGPESIKTMEHIFVVPALQISLRENKDSKSDKTKPKQEQQQASERSATNKIQSLKKKLKTLEKTFQAEKAKIGKGKKEQDVKLEEKMEKISTQIKDFEHQIAELETKFTSQTTAIAMQLGDELGFAPEEDKKYAALKVALDIQDALSEASAKRTEDPNSWVEVQKWLDTRFVAWAKSLEASHELYGGEYMMGDKMTYVDFLLMSLFDCGIDAFGGDRFKKAGEVAPKVFAIAFKMLEVDSVAQLIKKQHALPKKAQSDGEMPVVGDLVAKKGM